MCLKGLLLKWLDSNKACAHCWHEDKVAMTVLLASVEAASSSTCLWCGRKSEKCCHHQTSTSSDTKNQTSSNIIIIINPTSTINPSPTSLNHSKSQPFVFQTEKSCFVPRQVALVVARILANPCWQPMLLSLHVAPCRQIEWCDVPLPIGFHVWYMYLDLVGIYAKCN